MVEITKECALAIQSMVRHLYKEGVISIHGNNNAIHCTNEFFFSAFAGRMYQTTDCGEEYTEVYIEEDGIRWFCLIGKEVKEVKDA